MPEVALISGHREPRMLAVTRIFSLKGLPENFESNRHNHEQIARAMTPKLPSRCLLGSATWKRFGSTKVVAASPKTLRFLERRRGRLQALM